MIKDGGASLVGFGRGALAYPDFIGDLKETGGMQSTKVCVACGKCALLLRAGKEAGCVVRDREQYKES